MIPSDYETVTVRRSNVGMVDGRRVAGEPEPVGRIGVFVAPVMRDRLTQTGRVTLRSGVLDMREGDLVDVRGETMVITGSPMQWRRGDRVIGWQWHCEHKEDI